MAIATKSVRIPLSALIIISVVLFIPGLSLAEQKDDQYIAQPLTISKILGEVKVLPKDTLTWQQAQSQGSLHEGDKIMTGQGAKAELAFRDGSFARLKEETTLIIKTARERASGKASQHQLDLRVGEIMLELKKLKGASTFEVETPTAVAAVRGTTYYIRTGTTWVGAVEQAFVEIYVASGSVMYTNILSDKSCIVPGGLCAIVYDDGTLRGPYGISPAAQEAWRSGFDMVDDGSGAGKKGMRDTEEEEAEDDTGKDVDDTTDSQNESQNSAYQDRLDEQDITGLAKVTLIIDSDGDGVPDKDDLFPADPNRASGNDSDGDGIDDEFDNNDNDGPLGDLDGDGVNNADDLYPADPNRASGNDLDGDGIDDEFDNDIDGDGYSNNSDAFPRDYWEHIDSDGDGIGDFEDAFAQDSTIHPDTPYSAGYGSRDELRQAALDNLLAIQGLRQDIRDMIDDIALRQFEALKEEIFDHQAAKVMLDRWGNRVRVEEYISQPTDEQVQVLALNLRTAGPNAGISSFDFRVQFDEQINGSLRDLPWPDYMDNPIVDDIRWISRRQCPGEDDDQLILYGQDSPGYYNPKDYNYPVPLEFSLEVKNPYADSVKVTESYSQVSLGTIRKIDGEAPIWYQIQQTEAIEINGQAKQYADDSWYGEWGQGWNDETRFSFVDRFTDGSWLMGAFYLINDNAALIDPAIAGEGKDYLDNVRGLRDCINPDFNLEMVFLSSEFAGTDINLPDIIAARDTGIDQAYERYLYETYRNIDVITIPEITEPYNIQN